MRARGHRLPVGFVVGASYGFAVLAVAVMACVRMLLDPLLQDHSPFIFFMFAAIVTARYCGWKPAALALLLGVVVGMYVFVEPHWQWASIGTPHFVGMIVYLILGAITIGLSESQLRAKAELKQANALLEQRVEEWTKELAKANVRHMQAQAARGKEQQDV